MRLNVTKKDFLPVVKFCADILPANPHSPHLAGGVLSADGDRASVYATDLEIFCKVSFPAEVVEAGGVAAPLKKLAALVDRMDDGSAIQLSAEGNFQTRVRGGGTDTLLSGFDPEDYPQMPESDEATTVEVPAGKFLKAVRRVAYAASKDPARPVFNGLWMECVGGEITMTCCDTIKLATESVSAGQSTDFKVNLPLRPCVLLGKWLDQDDDEPVEIKVGESYVRFTKEPVTVVARAVGLEFPDWRKVVPTDLDVRVKASVGELVAAAERVAVVTDDKWYVAEIEVLPGRVVMKADTPYGVAKEVMSAETEGSTAIHLNVAYFLQTLKAVGEGAVEVSLPGGGDGENLPPAVFRFDAAPEHLAILLPVIIRNF